MSGRLEVGREVISEGRLELNVCDLDDLLVDGLGEIGDPMLSLKASAILTDLLRSSSLKEVSLESPNSSSTSSVNPAAYISIASSTVRMPSPILDSRLEIGSTVTSVMEVSLVTTLLRVVSVA